MPGLIIIVVVFVALAVLVLFWMLRWSKDRAATAEELESPPPRRWSTVGPQRRRTRSSSWPPCESQGFTTRMDSSGEALRSLSPTPLPSRSARTECRPGES